MKLSPLSAALLGASGAAAQLKQITDYGPAIKSAARMFVYEPAGLPEKPAVLVGVHYCTGTAQKYYNGSPYKGLADQKKFVVVYPESPNEGGCWDVSSRATLKRDGGSDSNAIANMVKYAVYKYQADPKRVFLIGESSGGMMAVSLIPPSDLGETETRELTPETEHPRGGLPRALQRRH